MTTANIDEKAVFNAARQIGEPAVREAYLQAACGSDAEALQRIGKLLRVFERADSFLEAPAGAAYSLTLVDRPITESPGTVIGPYKLLEQIGEGGFGVVFMAEQTSPVKRKVALKVIKPGMDTREVIARFEAERQALALMDHPNIAKVFDAGATGTGRPYFVMELVRGIPITEYCDKHQLSPKKRLELFVTVCQAVQHAHQKGIIHRDIKPSNVLVTQHDETAVVKVIDFGVAKAMSGQLTDKTLFTGFTQMIGTPLYMSPEQAEMSGLGIDTRTDIYGLGVLLYELLTGTTPFDRDAFQTAGFDEIRRIIREQEPAPPSARISTLARSTTVSTNRRSDPQALRKQCRGELDWIVMNCLEKDRNRRYETASALAADVQRYLSDEPVLACPPSTMYRCRKFIRRNRREVLASAAVALAGVVILGASSVLVSRSLESETNAKEELAETLERRRVESYFHRITLAHHALLSDDLGRAVPLLDECPEDLRGWEWRYLSRLCKIEPKIIRDKAEVNSLAFRGDGEFIAAACGDGHVRIWNSRTGEVVRDIDAHAESAACVVFHPEREYLASAGADKLVKVWNLLTGQEVFRGPCDAIRRFGAAYTVAFSRPDGRYLAAGCDRTVKVWDWKASDCLHSFADHENHSIPVAFSPDGRLLATGGAFQQGQRLWDTHAGGPPLHTFPSPGHPVSALAFSPSGKQLASASFDKSVKLWDTTTGGLVHQYAHPANVMGVAFSPDGQRLASSGEDRTVRLWDAKSGREVLSLRGHAETCTCVAFSPDGQRLASASTDRSIRFWDATPLRGDESQELVTFRKHTDEVRSVAFSADGQQVASAGLDKIVRVWDARTGRISVEFPAHPVIVFCLAWAPDDLRIATSGGDLPRHVIKVWDARSGQEVFRFPAGAESLDGAYSIVAFSPEGRYLVSGHIEGAVDVWDSSNGRRVTTLGRHNREVRGVMFSRCGQHLATASGDGQVKLWDATRLEDAQQPRLILAARVPGPSVNVAFSPDGQRLATGGAGYTVKIWDVESGAELLTLRDHTHSHSGEVYAVAFSPDDDGRWIASAGEDSAIKIWDSHTGEFIRNLRGHTALVNSLAFSPDGQLLVSGSRDATAKIWNVSQLSVSESSARQ